MAGAAHKAAAIKTTKALAGADDVSREADGNRTSIDGQPAIPLSDSLARANVQRAGILNEVNNSVRKANAATGGRFCAT